MKKKSILLILILTTLSNVYGQHNPSVSGQAEKFASALNTSLIRSSVGWGYEIRINGKIFRTNSGGFKVSAIDSSKGVSLPFDLTSRMHVASVSKSITAIAVAKLVELGKLSYDDKLIKYLPSFWKVHQGFQNTTIKDLITMKSGLDGKLDGASSHIDSLRVSLENGPSDKFIGVFNYQNISYGLLRIITAYALGLIESSADTKPGILSLKTANAYINFVNEYLFKPAGLSPVVCFEASTNPVLMYPYPYNNEHGYLSGGAPGAPNGNLTEFAGGFGWYLSVKDLSIFLNSVFFKKTIIKPENLDRLMSLNFPLKINEDKFGKYFGSGGDWTTPAEATARGGVHAYFYFFPGKMQVVVFVNSGDSGLRNLIIPAYKSSLN